MFIALFLVFTIVSAEPIISCISSDYKDFYVGWHYSYEIVLITSIVLIFLSLTPDLLIGRFLSTKIFARIGDASFGVYLIHFFFLRIDENLSPIRKFIIVYIVSFALAELLHYSIEEPIIQKIKAKKSDKVVRASNQ